MDRNNLSENISGKQHWDARSVAVLLISLLSIGLCLGTAKQARTYANGMPPTTKSGESVMKTNQSSATRHSVQTASGRIAYTEQGTGPVALYVHGVLLNGYLWRHQLADLSDIRRNIAVDLLAHGDTEITPDQDVSVTANAKML